MTSISTASPVREETRRTDRAAVFAAVQRAMLKVLRKQPTASADDIRPLVRIPAHVHPTIVGIAIRELRRDGLIVTDSTIATSRPAGRSHLMRVWRLATPPASERVAR